MLRFVLTIALFALSCAPMNFAYASGGGRVITLREALTNTWLANPDLLAARAGLQIEKENIDRALSGWRPNIGAYADITDAHYNTDPDSNLNDGTQKSLGIELSQPLYRGGSTSATVSASRSSFEGARAGLAAEEQKAILQAANAYMNVLEAIGLKKLALANRDVLKRERDAARQRLELGDLTKTDLSQANARLARANADLTQSEGVLDARIAAFEQITGISFDKGDTLAPPPENVLIKILPKDLDSAVEVAKSRAPDVLRARALVDAAEYEIRSTKGELLPQVDLVAGVDQSYDPILSAYDERTAQTLGVRATLPLYQGGETRARVRQAKSNFTRSKAVLTAAQRRAQSNAVQSWTALVAAKAITAAREQEVAAQKIARTGVRREAELGTRTTLDILNADQEYLDANVALVTARKVEIVARFALAASLGILPEPK